jgi:signal transduction histidine kinase
MSIAKPGDLDEIPLIPPNAPSQRRRYGIVMIRVVCLYAIAQALVFVTLIWAYTYFIERDLFTFNARTLNIQLADVKVALSNNRSLRSTELTRAAQNLDSIKKMSADISVISADSFSSFAAKAKQNLPTVLGSAQVNRVSLDWQSSPMQLVAEATIENDRRTYLVLIRNPLVWQSLLSFEFIAYVIALTTLFVALEASLLIVFLETINQPVRSLARALRNVNQLEGFSPLDSPTAMESPDVSGVMQELKYLQNAHEQVVASQRHLLRDLSHELRTPLTALRSVGELALSRPSDINASREALHSMLEEATHMQSLIEGLLTLTRAGEIVSSESLEIVDCVALVTECVSAMVPVAEESSQCLTADATGSLYFWGSYTIARQALMNLIFNAINHCPAACSISVSVSAADDDNRLYLTVADDGPGIDEAEHDIVFQRFRRGARTDKHLKGHGLGLAIAKAFVNAQGGILSLQSAAGTGARFTMSYRRHFEAPKG